MTITNTDLFNVLLFHNSNIIGLFSRIYFRIQSEYNIFSTLLKKMRLKSSSFILYNEVGAMHKLTFTKRIHSENIFFHLVCSAVHSIWLLQIFFKNVQRSVHIANH